jgi:hypothetical protein
VHYSLFTFGESELPYYLVTKETQRDSQVKIRRGEVRVTRPAIVTPDTAAPEFRGFFENLEEAGVVEYMLSRVAAFSHLKFANASGPDRISSDSLEEVISQLNRKLDDQEEDRIAILSAPAHLAGIAVLRYASERVFASAPHNIQELRERGFLP